ncbi:PTS system, cellobiose-specific IIA component [Carnobacterium iners]|uniref:PTS system, cellobiose-specific IIA component n=1 Tax=Carnobacterium iners TaxID=1073423 RepID=A0A1X7MWA0_9LACT|nr:PTS lactose/cellobiose transporter subunit IIA [Carnobacterium iners]SEL21597.1 PTS system, cellobiose-specific IIA component [Carnobacterium iners]SMH28672.1 PTS system, cellobiose-specific IIA component [Carnobacterium iners]
MEERIFEIIIHGGNARGMAYEALEKARAGEYDEMERLLGECKAEMTLAHNTQTKLVQDEIRGDEIKISLLLVHAQDQLMTAMAEQTLILQMIEMQKEINSLKK